MFDPKKLELDPYRTSSLDYLAASSGLEFNRNDLLKFFHDETLPLPMDLFPNEKTNTKAALASIQLRNWTTRYTSEDLHDFVNRNSVVHNRDLAADVANTGERSFVGDHEASFAIGMREVVITYKGSTATFKTRQGFKFIGWLLANPNIDTTPRQLYHSVSGRIVEKRSDDALPFKDEENIAMADDRSISDAKSLLDGIEFEMKKALADGDIHQYAELEEQKGKVQQYIKQTTDHKQRPKKERPPADEKSRKNVTKQIKDCVQLICCKIDGLKGIIDSPDILHTGHKIWYKVPPGISWRVEFCPRSGHLNS